MKELSNRTELFTRDDIDSEIEDFSKQIEVLDSEYLKDDFKLPSNQLYFAIGGSGCLTNDHSDKKIYLKKLNSEEEAMTLRRYMVLGVLKADLRESLNLDVI